jgi:uncharacterized protein (UPF0335 family)
MFVSKDVLQSYIQRIEKLEEEKKDISDGIKDVYSEARSFGYDTKVMKEIIKLRKKQPQEIEEEEYLLDTYKRALGMLPSVIED